jgi:hypothetical protein
MDSNDFVARAVNSLKARALCMDDEHDRARMAEIIRAEFQATYGPRRDVIAEVRAYADQTYARAVGAAYRNPNPKGG